MCWFLHCGPGPCLKHHHKSSNQIQWTESQNMAMEKLILYKTFHGQELKFYIESPKVSENLINFDCNKWKVMIQSSIIFELVPARSQWYICTKKNAWKLMEIFCRPIYVFLCVTLTFWGGRAPSWGRCWWRSDCGSGRCASRTPGSPDPGSTSTAAADSAGPETRQQSYLSLFGLELDREISLYLR